MLDAAMNQQKKLEKLLFDGKVAISLFKSCGKAADSDWLMLVNVCLALSAN